MRTVQAIIDTRGGLDQLAGNPIRLEVPGFMPLSVEWLGPGPDGTDMIAVAHWYEQHGDLCRDPEMTFQIKGEVWQPWSYRQDSLGLMQEAIFHGERGEILVRPKLLRELQKFARMWDKNIRDQGFLDAAKEVQS